VAKFARVVNGNAFGLGKPTRYNSRRPMGQFWALLWALALIAIVLLAACGPIVKSPLISDKAIEQEALKERFIIIEQLLREEAQLQRVAYKVMTASTHLCPKTRGALGFTLANKFSFGSEYASAMEQLYFTDGLTVSSIVLDSPAVRAGLRAGDAILTFNGQKLGSGKDSLDHARTVIDQRVQNTAVELQIQRNGTLYDITFELETACNYPVVLTNKGIINAFTDGAAISIDTGMMRFIDGDDELAIIIGHEVAHNIMGHIPKKFANFALGGVIDLALFLTTGFQSTAFGQMSAQLLHSQGFELEADYIGLYLTALAGYEINNAAQLWRRMGVFHPQFVTPKTWSTHPSSPERFAQLESTIAEIIQKRNAGAVLIPEGIK